MSKQSSAEVMATARVELSNAAAQKEILRKHYTQEARVPIYLSPMYDAYFGKVMRVSINGISIYLKVDGSTQSVPRTFADEITRRRMSIDTMLTKQGRMADIANNNEAGPGELTLF